jgi:hypothetical protein
MVETTFMAEAYFVFSLFLNCLISIEFQFRYTKSHIIPVPSLFLFTFILYPSRYSWNLSDT